MRIEQTSDDSLTIHFGSDEERDLTAIRDFAGVLSGSSGAYREMLRDLPGLARGWMVAASDYGEAFRDLGMRGQYSDMHRKMAKLKRAVWDGEVLLRETVPEIVGDLFGHVLISRYLLAEGEPTR